MRILIAALGQALVLLASGIAQAASFVDSSASVFAAAEATIRSDTGLDRSSLQSWSAGANAFADFRFPTPATGRSSLDFEFTPGEITALATATAEVDANEGPNGLAEGLAELELFFEISVPTPFEARGSVSFIDPLGAAVAGQAGYAPSIRLTDAADQIVFEELLLTDPSGFLPNDFVSVGTLDPGTYTLAVVADANASEAAGGLGVFGVESRAELALTLLPEPGTGLLLAIGTFLGARRRD